jgi:flavin reductase (DIM6/NTAB) family NADH-FMN oxidoreductase RutF
VTISSERSSAGSGPLDGPALRRVFGCFPSGVAAVCARLDDALVGIAASAFTPVSLDPPLVSLCVQNTSTTWPRLRVAPRLGISVLAATQDVACRRLAAKGGDRFAGLDVRTTAEGAVLVRGAVAWFACSIRDEVPAGDHTIVLMQVHSLDGRHDVDPLVFHASRFRTLAAS